MEPVVLIKVKNMDILVAPRTLNVTEDEKFPLNGRYSLSAASFKIDGNS
jgi:hypothetical protein